MRYLILSLILAASVNAEGACRDGRWVPVDGSPMMALRSNSCHFWAWAATTGAKMLPANWLEAVAVVTGDPHHENFSHITVGGHRLYVPNDLDDTGEAPVILEFLKFVGVARSVQPNAKDLSTELLAKSYIDGLTGKRFSGTFPEWLEADRAVTPAQLREAEHKEADRRETGGKFNTKEGLVPWKDMSSTEQREFTRLEEQEFKSKLPRGWEILDRATHSKGERGGSAGLSRYWYLLRDGEGYKHVLEFKELRQPAVWLYQGQTGTDKQRMIYSLQVYWGRTLPANFEVVQTGNRLFWKRPKLPNYVDFSVSEFRDKKRKFSDLSAFIAFNLGKWHGSQLGKKIERMGLEIKSFVEITDKFTEAYLKDVKKERRE
jgi:hypothetical protein